MFDFIIRLYFKIEDKIFLSWYDRKLKRQANEKMQKQLELKKDMEVLKRIAPNVFREDG
jgi:hypothetical protein